MGKTLITMATVALTAGLLAGTAWAGEGHEGGANVNQVDCSAKIILPKSAVDVDVPPVMGGTDDGFKPVNQSPACDVE
jgi:hypothetical protein